MTFQSMSQLMSQIWDTQEACVGALKKNGFKTETPRHRPARTDTGKWYIEELDPDASQEVPDMDKPVEPVAKSKPKPKPVKSPPPAPRPVSERSWPDPTTAKKWLAKNPQPGLAVSFDADRAVYCLRPNGPETPPPIVKPATEPKAAKPAAKPPASERKPAKLHKSSDPHPDELPDGFENWSVDLAMRPEGVLRTELARRLGAERRWQNYLKGVAKNRGLSFSMNRDGRFTRFLMRKD